MNYDQINPILRNWLGVREGFRKLGFDADEIYVILARSASAGGQRAVFCELRSQGKKFSVEVGLLPCPADEFEAHYREVCDAINSNKTPQEDLDRIWTESPVYLRKLAFTMALINKGFTPPNQLQ